MARSKFFSLWGQKASDDKTDDQAEDKAADGKVEDKAGDETGDDDAEDTADDTTADDKAGDPADDEEDDDENEDDEEDKATATAAAKVPSRVARHIRRAERARLHAIVDGAGPERVAAALHVALNSDMAAKDAVAFVKGLPAGATGGRLGLSTAMGDRPAQTLGPAGGAPTNAADKLASGILAHASKRPGGKS